MKNIFLLLLTVLFSACSNNQSQKGSEADRIVAKAIENAGGERYKNALIEFQFRENTYKTRHKNGLFEYSRLRKDSLGEIRDVLNNEGITSYRKDQPITMPDSVATAIANSVNSVHYFALLPYSLDGDAVIREKVGEDTIAGKAYHEIKVTFKEDGGGEDHEDVYMYWIEKEKFTVDYLAYLFYVNDGGIRFRKAVNPRVVNGIRLVDYENYKTDDLSTPLQDLDDMFERGELIKVSDIKNEILKVEIQQ